MSVRSVFMCFQFVDQLKPGGRMHIYVGVKYIFQKCFLVDKHEDGTYTKTYIRQGRIKPLIDKHVQLERYIYYEATTPDRLKEYADLIFSPEDSLYKIDFADRTDIGSMIESGGDVKTTTKMPFKIQ